MLIKFFSILIKNIVIFFTEHLSIKNVPFKSRQSYFYEIRAAIFEGVFTCTTYNLLIFIARKTINVEPWHIPLIMSGFFVGPLVNSFVPQLFRSSKKMKYIIWAGLLSKIPLFFIIYIESPLAFSIVSFLIFSVNGIGISAYVGIVQANYPLAVRSSIVAKVRTMQLITIIIFGYFAGELLNRNENFFKILFCIGGASGLMATYLFSKIIVRDERRKHYRFDKPLYSFADLFRVIKNDKKFRRYQNLYFLSAIPLCMVLPLILLFITDEIKADYSQISTIVNVLQQSTMLIMLPFWGWFLDKHSNAIFGRAIFTFLFALHILIYAAASNIWFVYVASVVSAIAFSGGQLNWLLGSLYFCKPKDAPLYSAIHSFYNGVRGLIGVWLALYVSRWLGFRCTFLILGLTTVVGGFLFVRFYLDEKSDASQDSAEASGAG